MFATRSSITWMLLKLLLDPNAEAENMRVIVSNDTNSAGP